MVYPLSLSIADTKGDREDLVRQGSRFAGFAIELGLEEERYLMYLNGQERMAGQHGWIHPCTGECRRLSQGILLT